MKQLDNNTKIAVELAIQDKGQQAKTDPLGILRNPPPPLSNFEGQELELSPVNWAKNEAQVQRKNRYKVLKSARQILLEEGRKQFPLLPTKYHRTTLCKHSLTGLEVAVLLSQEHGKAFFDGLQTCGSVWVCPLCGAKVQERRRLEIAQAMDYFYSCGNRQAVMITFTFPHKKHMTLVDLLKKQAEAFVYLRKGKQWDKFKRKIDFEGLIRSLEITWGLVNGWHPHTHELFFISSKVDKKSFIKFVLNRWKNACIKAGLLDINNIKQLNDFDTYAVDIKFNCKSSDYLAKVDHKDNVVSYWGADREIAKASSKTNTKGKGMHPFQLALDNKKDLFLEYVRAVKGKAQLFWSRGLKEKVGITEKTDEELAEEENNKAEVFHKISKLQWLFIREKDKKSQILNCVENSQDVNDLIHYISSVCIDKKIQVGFNNAKTLDDYLILQEKARALIADGIIAKQC